MKNKLCYYYFNNSCIGFISTCNYAKCNTDQVMNVSHNHTCMPVMFTGLKHKIIALVKNNTRMFIYKP